MQQTQLPSSGFHITNNQPQHHPSHQQQHGPPTINNKTNVNNNNINEIDNLQLSNSNNSGADNGAIPSEMQDIDNRLQPRDKQQLIAKPLASRPAPFLHHTLNHPHLHSLLAHCRNPYIGGR